MVTAMEQMQMEPVIIEDLVRYGEKRGFDKGLDQGVHRGIAQERLRMYDNLIVRRLRRPLMNHERQTLRQRIATTALERLDDVIFNASTDELEAWLADTDATPQHVEHK